MGGTAAIFAVLALFAASAAAQQRSLQQANAPAVAPGAKLGPKMFMPKQPSNFALLGRAGVAANTENGAFIGCYDITKLQGVAWDTQKKLDRVTGCRKVCNLV